MEHYYFNEEWNENRDRKVQHGRTIPTSPTPYDSKGSWGQIQIQQKTKT